MTTRRRRDRPRIRVRTPDTTDTPTPTPKPPKVTRQEVEQAAGVAPEEEIPRPIEEALRVKDLVPLHQLLSNAVLTPSEVATLLRVSPTTVMELVSDGEIPAMRIRKQTRLLRIDVLRFMRDIHDQQRQQKTARPRPRQRVRR